MSARYRPGATVKVRDKFTPMKSRRLATIVEDRGVAGVVCLVHHRAARGGTWQSVVELVPRERIIG
jgi:hypothetical protein